MHMAESAKPQTILRRTMQGMLPLRGSGIDVGAGPVDMPPEWRWWTQLDMDCTPWDVEQGDARLLEGVPDEHYDWLFSSHCLEHLETPNVALENWVRVVKPGGRLLISVPHRTLYEGRTRLPSKWNLDHKRFYLPFEDDGTHTVGLLRWLQKHERTMPFTILNLVTGDWGNTHTGEHGHPDGEYQIDAFLARTLT